jgi:phosphatidylglycerophosphate synthase
MRMHVSPKAASSAKSSSPCRDGAEAVTIGAAVAVVFGVAGLLLGRRPVDAGDLPDLAEYRKRWLAQHQTANIDPAMHTFVRPYTAVMFRLARPFARLGCHPDAITVAGLSLGAAVVALADSRLGAAAAGVVVICSLLTDGIDGAVAALTERSTKFGFVLDSVADRIVDVLWLAALVRVGASVAWAVAAAGALMLLEYVRARGLAASSEAGVITVGERPTRMIAAAIGLVGYSVVPDLPGPTGAAVITAVTATIGSGHLLIDVRRRLN